jgi:hypothetical protein
MLVFSISLWPQTSEANVFKESECRLIVAGGQDTREVQRNAEAPDGNRRRLSTGVLPSGSMEAPKHKSPGLDDTTAKEVCFSLFINFMLDLLVVQLIVTIAL